MIYSRWGKRALDLILSTVGLAMLSPLLLIIALLVILTSRGPAFYRQQRVGRNGELFRIVKFRSMVANSDKSGPLITSTHDPRVTCMGRFLRRYKLDELPQLWNVVKGEMSLVGPRPEVPRYVKTYSPLQRRVLLVRPGITDPASILYRHEEELLGQQADPDRYYRDVVLPDKLRLNLEYLGHISFSYDTSLVLRTTRSIFVSQWIPRTE
jgi:lipopolysaccharide/colanic/teichoic acid biosynthesis glycosyltransferase